MTDFDLSEISAFQNTWPNIIHIICTFHAVAGQHKWIDRNAPKAHREKLKAMFKALHFVQDDVQLKRSIANLKRFCTVKGLHAVKKYLQQSWEPFTAMWVQFYRKDFWSGQANTNNISEGRIGSFKRGLKNVTDGSIYSLVKYLLYTYAPDDVQDFLKLNRDNAWENKKLVRIMGVPFLQNRPPGAVAAINQVYARAAKAIDLKRYRYRTLGHGRYSITNNENGHRYKFTLQKADCICVDNKTNIHKIPCIHAIFLLLRLKLNWSHFHLPVRRNIRNSLIKVTDAGWKILGSPKESEDMLIEKFWESADRISGDDVKLESEP